MKTEEELEEYYWKEYTNALDVCRKLFPDIFGMTENGSYGFISCNRFKQNSILTQKIEEFKKDPEFTRPFDKEYYDNARHSTI